MSIDELGHSTKSLGKYRDLKFVIDLDLEDWMVSRLDAPPRVSLSDGAVVAVLEELLAGVRGVLGDRSFDAAPLPMDAVRVLARANAVLSELVG